MGEEEGYPVLHYSGVNMTVLLSEEVPLCLPEGFS